MEETPVQLEREGPIATVRLDRPDRLNAFDGETLRVLEARLLEVARDDAVRVVILTGTGRAFCAGGDLRAVLEGWPERPGDGFHGLASVFHRCIVELRTMPKPVVAALNGPAAGGGFSMALACDLRVMGESGFLQQAYTSSGLTLDGGGTSALPRMLGLSRALEIALLDPRIPADRALELGLVHRVVPDAEVLGAAQSLASELAGRAVGALGRVKALMNGAFDRPLEVQLEAERRTLAEAADAAEGREGLAAFVEKRAPDFPGAAGGGGRDGS